MSALAELLDRTARCLARYESLAAAPAVLAAVSGGLDSSVLAVVLARLAAAHRLPGPLVLGYVDHRQHGGSALAAAHVQALSASLGAGFLGRVLDDVGPGAAEAELREARYAALAAMAAECDAGYIVTAHHADDDIETILFRMLRGTGLRGLTGIPEHRQLGPRLHLLRPFLGVRRATLEQVAREVGVQPFVDPSNADLRFARNRLRHELIPELRARAGAGNLDASLFALASSARAAAGVLAAQARRLLTERCRQPTAWRAEIDLHGLDDPDAPFLLEALRQLDERLRPAAKATPRPVLERVVAELWRGLPGKRVHGGGQGLLYERTRAGLLVVDPSCAGPPPAHAVSVGLGDQVAFGATGFVVATRVHGEPPLDPSPAEAGRHRALLDLDAAPPPFLLRARRPGDRFVPLGMASAVELRRFMQARGVPRFDRDRIPLLLDRSERILWVPGGEIAQAAAITPFTSACVEVVVGLR